MPLEEDPKQSKVFNKEDLQDNLSYSRLSKSIKNNIAERGKMAGQRIRLEDEELKEIADYIRELRPTTYREYWEALLSIGIWPPFLLGKEEEHILDSAGLSEIKVSPEVRVRLSERLLKIRQKLKKDFTLDDVFSNPGPMPPIPPPWG